MIPEKDRINIDDIIEDFINAVNEDSPDLSTDPNVKRVKVKYVDPYDYPCCGEEDLE